MEPRNIGEPGSGGTDPNSQALSTRRQADEAGGYAFGSQPKRDVVPLDVGDKEEGARGSVGDDDEQWALKKRRKAMCVDEARKRRALREAELVRKEEEARQYLRRITREKELRSVRQKCLPDLVFLFHEVSLSLSLSLSFELLWNTRPPVR